MLNYKPSFATIEWRDGIPFSVLFNDYYCSKQSGSAESDYVFIKHNNLPQRISELKPYDKLVIGETGFGCGINLFTTLKLWQNLHKDNLIQLHYISIERYPLKPSDLYKAVALFPELNLIAKEFFAQYALLTPGYHRFYLGNNFHFTLIIDDILNSLTQLNSPIDIWYLDGFSPNKNSEMWGKEVIEKIANLSTDKTTFSTYSANGELRRTLIACGATLNKTQGFGGKREMIYGKFNPQTRKPFLNKCYLAKPNLIKPIKKIGIIGGGISGATTAYSLAKRGYQVTLFERNQELAQEASGNHQGVIYANFSIHDKLMFELNSNSWRLTSQLIKKLDHQQSYHHQCGVIQLAHNLSQQKRNQELVEYFNELTIIQAINASQIERLSGVKAQFTDGIFFANGMWINPHQFIIALTTNIANITIRTNQHIINLEHIDNHWSLTNHLGDKFDNFDAIILCNSFCLNQFIPTQNLAIRKIRGQVSQHQAQSPVKCVVCGDGYITPNFKQDYIFGATFDFKQENFTVTNHDHQQNITTLNNMLQSIQPIEIDKLSGKTSLRVSSHDYLPIIGPISDKQNFFRQFNKLQLDKNYRFKQAAEYLPNLYINSGYGSKGLLWAALGGEIIADYLSNTPLATSENLRQALHPNRIYARELIKR